METNYTNRRGSSLLITLLIMTAVSILLVSGSRAVVESSRSVGTLDAQTSAQHIAESGLQEGLLYLRQNNPVLQAGEYGVKDISTTPYSLRPLRRGFSDSACTVMTPAAATTASTANTDCPYYDLAIRNSVGYSGSTNPPYTLSSRDVPHNQPIALNLQTGEPITFHPQTGGGTVSSYTYALCPDITMVGCTAETPISTSQDFIVQSTKTYKALKIRALYTAGVAPTIPATLMTISPASTNEVALGKGNTTIDVTGYMGNVQKRYVITARVGPGGTLVYTQTETAQYYDQNGVLKP
jgi:Tfp pilus assembly protein PilX